MDKHISTMRYATQCYDKAADAALAEIEGTRLSFNLALASLNDAYEFFLSTLEKARECTGQQAALQLEAVQLNAAEVLLVRADNGVPEERGMSLSQISDDLHRCNAELEKLLEYHQNIPDLGKLN